MYNINYRSKVTDFFQSVLELIFLSIPLNILSPIQLSELVVAIELVEMSESIPKAFSEIFQLANATSAIGGLASKFCEICRFSSIFPELGSLKSSICTFLILF